MPTFVPIVGNSGSGKTTLIEKLIPELKDRGYRIGSIKHTHHDVAFDTDGKDSARHRAAGADTVILASETQISMVRTVAFPRLDDLKGYFTDLDLVITEGYKREPGPKIEVYRPELGKRPLYVDDPDCIAVVTDAADVRGIRTFGLSDVADIADFIESRFVGTGSGMNRLLSIGGEGAAPTAPNR